MFTTKVTKIRRHRSSSKRSLASKSKCSSRIRIHTRIHTLSLCHPQHPSGYPSEVCPSSSCASKLSTRQMKFIQGREERLNSCSKNSDDIAIPEKKVSNEMDNNRRMSVNHQSTLSNLNSRSGRKSSMGTLQSITEQRKQSRKRRSKSAQFRFCSRPCICIWIWIMLIAMAALAALLTGLLTGSPLKATTKTTTTIKPPVLYVNLVKNGDGETGPCESESNVTSPTGWNYTGPVTQLYYNRTSTVDQTLTTPGPSDRGQCYFYGHSSASTSMWQTIDLLDYADSTYIDSQSLKFNLSGWFGGITGQDDYAFTTVSFENDLNQSVGLNTSIGFISNANRSSQKSMMFCQTSGDVPSGARFLTVLVTFIRVLGWSLNAHVDNIVFYLYQ